VALIFAILLGIGGYILKETRFGLYLYAVGNNDEAARRAGVKVARIKMAAFAIAGGIAALAGVLGASRALGVGVFSGGAGGGTLLLESIAATVIGGVSLFGGRGSIHAALLGALVIGTVQNGLNLMGVENCVRLIVTGLLLVLVPIRFRPMRPFLEHVPERSQTRLATSRLFGVTGACGTIREDF